MSSRRWIVREEDGADVGAIVARAAPNDPRAIAEGRVFVGKTRVTRADERVSERDVVTVHAPRAASAEEPRILLRSNDVVAAEKPAAMPTIADHHGAARTLVSFVAASVGRPAASIHPTSRLDVGVSGVVLFALSDLARARLARARENGCYARLYLAIADRSPAPAEGTWDAPIGRAPDPRHRAVGGRDAIDALTRFRVVALAKSGHALLRLEPVTGRTHQLRVHAAHAGAPLSGDSVYGGSSRLTLPSGAVRKLDRVMLHAHRVRVTDDPKAALEALSPVPEAMSRTWTDLGGDPDDLLRAVDDRVTGVSRPAC